MPQVSLHFESEDSIRQYLDACQHYISTPKNRSLDYVFPDIRVHCPVCQASGCAVWKGYYLRQIICFKLRYSGYVVIRCGRCRIKKRHFSMFPDFLIPRLRLTKFSLEALQRSWSKERSVEKACEALGTGLGEAFDVPLSTAYFWLYGLIMALRLNAEVLMIPPPMALSLGVFDDLRVLEKLPLLFSRSLAFRPGSESIRPPPI